MCDKLSIIIPSAGMGRRMKSYGPKPLIELSSRYTVIGRQQSILRKTYPNAEIIVVVGYEADAVIRSIDPCIKIVENENYETTNVVRSIGIGLRVASHNNVLIVYGDLVFNKSAINIAGNNSVALMDNRGMIRDDEVGATVVDGRITRFSYDLNRKWAQITYLTGNELELFKKVAWNRDNSKWFGFEALNQVIDYGGIIRGIENKMMRVAEIDTSKDIDQARTI